MAARASKLLQGLSLLATACLPGCGQESGLVELDWLFVDRDFDRIFPNGEEGDMCQLVGISATGSRRYDLGVRLTVIDEACEGTEAECVVAQETFDCDRARGAIREVPSSDAAYRMVVEIMAQLEGEDPFVVSPDCIAVPGPRTRVVKAGRITDLAVYEFVAFGIDIDDPAGGALDLEGCRAP